MMLFRWLAALLLLALWGAAGLAQDEAAGGAAAAVDAAAAAAPTASPTASPTAALRKFAVVATLLVAPLIVGNWLAGRLRMPDYGWKFALALGTLAAALVLVAPALVEDESEVIKLGPDLSGGITLIYELEDAAGGDGAAGEGAAGAVAPGEGAAPADDDETSLASSMSRDQLVDVLIKALTERVDPSGTKEVTIRKYGEGQIEIIIPKAGEQELEYIQRRIYTAGALEFRITASRQFSDHRLIIEEAEQLAPGVNVLTGADGKEIARWAPYEVKEFGPPDVDDGRIVKRKNVDEPQALVLTNDQLDVTGEYLSSATPGVDEAMRPQVNFTFNAKGAGRFAELTGSHLPNPSGQRYSLGILLDNRLLSAPSIEGRISDQGRISGGNMNEEEVNFVVGILNAGSLPAALNKDPISREQISPTLGKETVAKGKNAILWSMIAVIAFMAFYYRFAGLVACLALAANLLLTVAAMVLIKGAFTLPGLAGLALTVGMSVDANVLIYERMREELRRGSTLRMAIRNGFSRATSTIIDSNLTTLITAIVIYKIAPDNVKGFGVTLILGILVSMYSAIFLSRLMFDVAERLGWIKTLRMAKVIGDTHFDFLGKAVPAIALSLLVIGVGMAAVYARGRDLLNIDFTGGSSVTMVLKDDSKKPFSEVNRLLRESPLGKENLSLVEVGDTNTRYTVTTINQDVEAVQKILGEIFPGQLRTYRVDVGDVTPLAARTDAGRPPADGEASLAERMPVSLVQEEPGTAADDTADRAASAEDAPPSAATLPAAAAVPAPAAATGTAAADRFAGGVATRLSFGSGDADLEGLQGGVSYDTLDQILRDALEATGHKGAPYQISNPDPGFRVGTARRYVDWDVKLPLAADPARQVVASLEKSINDQPIFPLANKIGGRVAGRMTSDAIAAIVISLLGIIAYVWFRFHGLTYGLAAVIALIHDTLVTLGAVALSSYLVQGAEPLANLLQVQKFQISLTLLAAFLTIIGYSLNDTIVIFDRIREIKGKSPRLTADMINASVNQTLSRTILTAFTTLLTVVVLYLMGGEGIHDFAFALLVGVVVGTYSTVFIATPLLLWMSDWAESSGDNGGSKTA